MKKFLKIAVSAILAATVALPIAACTPSSDPNVLNIICLDKGYGSDWINTIADKFEEENEGYTVKVTATAEAGSLITSHLNSKNNTDDLYISVGSSWKTYAAQGKFASLDDLLEDTVDGVKVKDKVAVEYSESIYIPDRTTGGLKSYRLPWTSGVGGIFYNKTMFEENGWSDWLNETYNLTGGVPETYEQLLALTEKIVADDASVEVNGKLEKVYPFVYTSANIDYFDYAVYTWWAQLAGEDAVKEFTKYEAASNYDAQSNQTYAYLKQATEMWYNLFSNSSYYTSGTTNHTAQTMFVNGYAAMMFNGDWLYNETLGYGINNGFRLALMKTPVATGAQDPDITYTIGEDQYIAIPASSQKQELAKQFIKLMVSDWGCEVFMNEAHGLLAYKNSLTADSTDDEFMSNLITVKNGYTSAFTSYPTLSAITAPNTGNCMLNLNDLIDIWGTSSLRPYTRLIQGQTTVAEAFTTIYTEINRNWNDWRKQIGLN